MAVSLACKIVEPSPRQTPLVNESVQKDDETRSPETDPSV